MTEFYGFQMSSKNAKTGPMPVTTGSKSSCPDSCPMKNNGCYASNGRINIHWTKLNSKGLDFRQLLLSIRMIQPGNIWRLNQAGDLPGKGERINSKQLASIVGANKGKRGFTYTHKYHLKSNHKLIKFANDNGFTVNLSANNLNHADKLADLNIGPVVVVTPSNALVKLTTPKGRKVIQCPATYKEGVTCLSCQLCQKQRNVIVHFPAHGIAKKRVDAIAIGK